MRSLAALLVAVSVTLVAPSPAQAAEVTTTVNDVVYTADDTDVDAGATVNGYVGNGGPVTLQNVVTIDGTDYPVTSVGDEVFKERGITGSLTIPDNVRTIGDNAFPGNTVTGLTLGTGLKTIGVSAFQGNLLTAVTIPNNVTTINQRAFQNQNGSLASVTLGNSVTTIGEEAFRENALTSLTIPNAVTALGKSAFQDNELTSVVLGGSLTSIAESAFRDNQLAGSLTIPDSVTAIGVQSFANNDITTLTLGSKIATIGDSAFRDSALTSLTIPDTVTSIGQAAFQNNQLTSLTLGSGVKTIGESAFRANDLTGVEIPASVTAIGLGAFESNIDLESVRFFGAAPSTGENSFGPTNLGNGGAIVRYRPQFGGEDPDVAFTQPTWRGYATQAYGIVSFDANGGTPEPERQLVDVGQQATEPADPAKPGTQFRGWFTSTAATTPYDFDTTVTGDVPLTARYGIQPTISGTAGDATVGESYEFQPTVTGDPAPTVTLTKGALPDGLTLDASTGKISGTPSDTAGEYDATLTATNQYGSDDLDITIDLAAGDADHLVLEASDTTPRKGDTITVTTTAEDEAGNDLGNWDANSTLTSDVDSDEIDGNQVTFRHASPHTITATDDENADVAGSIVIQVDGADGNGNGRGVGNGLLPNTGGDLTAWGLTLALVLVGLGTALVGRRRVA